jgi:Phosphopantetheine attachment site
MKLVTETERYLATLWAELLGVERVEPTDDFFSLGGNSLQIFRARHRIRRDLDVNIAYVDLLRTTVLCDLAEELDDMRSDLGP